MFVGLQRYRSAVICAGSRCLRALSASPKVLEKPLPPRIVVPEGDIEESFLKGTGPGGQKINKTSSAVQLKHLPTGIVVKNQETRSRDQNRKNARRILGERLEELEKGPLSRTAIKAVKASKKKASAAKKSRRKYRKLEDGKTVPAEVGDDVHTEDIGFTDSNETVTVTETANENAEESTKEDDGAASKSRRE